MVINDEHRGLGGRIKNKIIPSITLLLVLAISVALFFYGRNPETVARLKSLHYLGAFLVSLIGNATILLPGIVLPILTTLGIFFYKSGGIVQLVIIGLAGGAGAAIGEIVGYMAGYSGSAIIGRRKLYERLEGWVRRWGSLAIFVLALFPLFFDLVGIAAGVIRFPLWKFILVCCLGRTVLYVFFLLLAALGWKVVLPWFG